MPPSKDRNVLHLAVSPQINPYTVYTHVQMHMYVYGAPALSQAVNGVLTLFRQPAWQHQIIPSGHSATKSMFKNSMQAAHHEGPDGTWKIDIERVPLDMAPTSRPEAWRWVRRQGSSEEGGLWCLERSFQRKLCVQRRWGGSWHSFRGTKKKVHLSRKV